MKVNYNSDFYKEILSKSEDKLLLLKAQKEQELSEVPKAKDCLGSHYYGITKLNIECEIQMINEVLKGEIHLIKEQAIEQFINQYKYTSCEDCIHKKNDCYTEECMSCKHYYPCNFEKKQ